MKLDEKSQNMAFSPSKVVLTFDPAFFHKKLNLVKGIVEPNLSMKEGSLFCGYEICWTGMLQFVPLECTLDVLGKFLMTRI